LKRGVEAESAAEGEKARSINQKRVIKKSFFGFVASDVEFVLLLFLFLSFFLALALQARATMAAATTAAAAAAGDLPDWLDAEDVLGDDGDDGECKKGERRRRESKSFPSMLILFLLFLFPASLFHQSN